MHFLYTEFHTVTTTTTTPFVRKLSQIVVSCHSNFRHTSFTLCYILFNYCLNKNNTNSIRLTN